MLKNTTKELSAGQWLLGVVAERQREPHSTLVHLPLASPVSNTCSTSTSDYDCSPDNNNPHDDDRGNDHDYSDDNHHCAPGRQQITCDYLWEVMTNCTSTQPCVWRLMFVHIKVFHEPRFIFWSYQLVLYEHCVSEYLSIFPLVSLPRSPFWLSWVSLNATKSNSFPVVQNVPIDCVAGEIRSYASAVRFVILSFVSGWSQDGSGDTCETILMTRWWNIHSAAERITIPGSTQL